MDAEFDRYASEYDELLRDPVRDRFARNPGFFHIRKWMVLDEFLRSQGVRTQGLKWLDVGCGRGELLRCGKDAVAAATGCDPSKDMLAHCDGLDVSLQPEPERVPFENGRFDIATAACVYHHLTPGEQVSLTKEVGRVLRPGGIFAIFEHNPWNPVTRGIVRRTAVDANATLLSAGELRRLVRRADLEPIGTRYYLWAPEHLFGKLRRIESALGWLPGGGQYAVFARRPTAA